MFNFPASIFTFSQPPPPAGNEWELLLDQNADYSLIGGRFQFTTAAGGGARAVRLQVLDVALKLFTIEPPIAHVAAMTNFYSFAPFGGTRSNQGINEFMMSWPIGTMLKSNWSILTDTQNLQAGDQFSQIELAFMRWAHRTV